MGEGKYSPMFHKLLKHARDYLGFEEKTHLQHLELCFTYILMAVEYIEESISIGVVLTLWRWGHARSLVCPGFYHLYQDVHAV